MELTTRLTVVTAKDRDVFRTTGTADQEFHPWHQEKYRRRKDARARFKKGAGSNGPIDGTKGSNNYPV